MFSPTWLEAELGVDGTLDGSDGGVRGRCASSSGVPSRWTAGGARASRTGPEPVQRGPGRPSAVVTTRGGPRGRVPRSAVWTAETARGIGLGALATPSTAERTREVIRSVTE